MDWTEKMKRRREMEKMAARMLGCDLKNIIVSWKIILLILVIGLFLIWPYLEIDQTGQGGFFFFLMTFLMLIYPVPEKIFFFLPMSEQDIRWYLSARCNLYSAGMVLISIGFAGVMELLGKTVYWLNGIQYLLIPLFMMEFLAYNGIEEFQEKTPRHKVWNIICNICFVGGTFFTMMVGLFNGNVYDDAGNVKTYVFLYISLAFYIVGFVVRINAMRHAHFKQYKVLSRSYWDTRKLEQKEV